MKKEDKNKISLYNNNYYNKNIESIKQKRHKYYENNKDKFKLRNKKYQKNNKDKINKRNRERNKLPHVKDLYYYSHLKNNYGISKEEHVNLLLIQDNKCAICRMFEVSKNTNKLSVDHCHKTGKVRGLLCQKCNSIVAYCNEDINILKMTIEYINKHNIDLTVV